MGIGYGEQSYSEIVRNTMQRLGEGHLEDFTRITGDNLVYNLTGRHPFAGIITGPEGVVAMMRSIREAFDSDGLKYEIERMIDSGDSVISVFRGRGALKNGRSYDNCYCAIWDFKDGKLVRITEFFDSHHAVSAFMP